MCSNSTVILVPNTYIKYAKHAKPQFRFIIVILKAFPIKIQFTPASDLKLLQISSKKIF